MVTTAAPVTPSVLAWAVNEDGRNLYALSEALEVAPDTLDAWVLGDALPSAGDVSRLAKVLGRPRALFFLPQPPETATLPASFRHPPGDDRQVSPRNEEGGPTCAPNSAGSVMGLPQRSAHRDSEGDSSGRP